MSKRDQEAAPVGSDAQGKSSVATVNRDSAFVRVGADVSFAALFNDDIDITLLVRQALYRNIVMGENEQPSDVKVAKTLVEVARLRMPASSAMLMALNVLGACASAGIVELEGFEENIELIRKAIIEADADEED